MKVVYIAGPFRSTNPDGRSNSWGVQQNVMQAMAVALEVWKMGHAALCPHANTMFFQDADGTVDSVWLRGDLEMLKRCDALMLAPNWEKSSGARAEVEFAQGNKIPVFTDLDDLYTWLRTSVKA